MTYPGTTAVPIHVNTDGGGVIRMSVPRKYLKALGPLDAHGRPTLVGAVKGSRLYSGTAFSMGNVSANEAQGYLYPVDGTAAFEFVVGTGALAPTRSGAGAGAGAGSGPGTPASGGSGRLPATGGLGWPGLAVGVLAAGLLLARRRASASH
jgi:hypothetical protein